MPLLRQGMSLRETFFIGAAALALPYSTEAAGQITQINLTTDSNAFLTSQGLAPAANQDSHLINPWGMSFGPTTPFWISDQGTNVATLYTGNGTPAPQPPLIVSIPTTAGGPQGPTGQVFAGGSGFTLGTGTATFVFANLNGTISAWNPASGTNAQVVVPNSPPAPGAPPTTVYTGLALGSVGSSNFLYAANNAANRIDVFNQSFAPTTLAGSFVDPNLPAGLAPFNIANIGGRLFVTYATPGPDADEAEPGTGLVDIFNTDGTFAGRFATGSLSGGTNGNLLSPWGVALAPNGFDGFAGDILIGNFSDELGLINIFDPSGSYLGALTVDGTTFNMPYLWALGSRTGGPNVNTSSIYFTAGIGDELHGLFAELRPVPEPSTWAMMLVGFGAIGLTFRRRPKLKAALPNA